MTFIAIPDTVKVAIRCATPVGTQVNTLYFRRVGGWTMGDAEDLCDDLGAWFTTNILNQFHESVEYLETTAYDMTSVSSWSVNSLIGTGTAGGYSTAPASLASAMTVTFRTSVRGRSGRGRNYLSGFIETNVGQTQFDGTLVSAINTAYNLIPATIASVGGEHVVASLYTGGAPRVTGVTYLVTSYLARTEIHSQRNRTRF